MSLPLAETTITIIHPSPNDSYDEVTWTEGQGGIPALFSAPRGSANEVGGDQERIDMMCLADPCTVDGSCRLRDEKTNITWSVAWVQRRTGLGLDHMAIGVRHVRGRARG